VDFPGPRVRLLLSWAAEVCAVFVFWVLVVVMLVGLYAGLVAAGLMDLSLGVPPNHFLRRLARALAGPFRRAASDEDVVEEMARRLRGGPGSWPTAGSEGPGR